MTESVVAYRHVKVATLVQISSYLKYCILWVMPGSMIASFGLARYPLTPECPCRKCNGMSYVSTVLAQLMPLNGAASVIDGHPLGLRHQISWGLREYCLLYDISLKAYRRISMVWRDSFISQYSINGLNFMHSELYTVVSKDILLQLFKTVFQWPTTHSCFCMWLSSTCSINSVLAQSKKDWPLLQFVQISKVEALTYNGSWVILPFRKSVLTK